ncbi:MAG: hypothetical protein QOE61_3867, partial [Micromonosporaceae bacterium]|nr:hypothetical protein [Micromonosporaceae bacterium]
MRSGRRNGEGVAVGYLWAEARLRVAWTGLRRRPCGERCAGGATHVLARCGSWPTSVGRYARTVAAAGPTHVVLAASLLSPRAYTIAVIGAALVGAARGEGHRPLAARLGVNTVVSLDQDLLASKGWSTTQVGQALQALAVAAVAIVRRYRGDE